MTDHQNNKSPPAHTETTPRPWKYEELDPTDPEWGACEIWPDTADAIPEPVATMVCGVDNAKLIVKAVNCHADLLEALEAVENDLEIPNEIGNEQVFAKVRAAIVKAKAGAP